MAAFGCTITVDTAKMPSSQSNFTWLFTEQNFLDANNEGAIDGGLTSIDNGGGNLRCYTDSTKATQLPIDIVAFVTGGTPSVVVRGLSSTLNVASTVYIEADEVATTQPAASSTFGSESVWVDAVIASHDTISDSAGGATVTVTGSITANTGVFGDVNGGGLNDTSSDYVTFTGVSVSSEWTIMAWVDTNFGNSRFACLGQIGSTGNQANLGLNGSNNAYYSRNGTDPVSANTYNGGSSYEFFAGRESSTLDNLIWVGDGTDSTTTTYDSSFPTLDRARIFKSADDTPFGNTDMIISAVVIYDIGLSDDYIESIHSNQSNSGAFWTTSAWVEQGGGGISGTITQTTNSFTQSLVGTVANPTTTGTITQTTQSFTQSAVGTVFLNISGTITQSASAFTQSLSGTVVTNITGVIEQTLSSFTQSLLGSVSIPVTGNINQTASSFTQSAIGNVPLNIPESGGLVGNQSLGNGISSNQSFGNGIVSVSSLGRGITGGGSL